MSISLKELTDAERSSLAFSRELELAGDRIGIEELLAIAQISMFTRESSEITDSRSLYTEESGRELISSARILDALSSGDRHPDSRRATHLASAVCFAMQGNFPSATAVLGRLDMTDPSPIESVIASLCSPGNRKHYLGGEELPPAYLELLSAHDAFHTGAQSQKTLRARFVEFAGDMINREETFYQSLLDGLQIALRQNIRLSTHRCLTKYCPGLSARYISNLVKTGVPTLLPTQYMAARRGLLTSPKNAIISVPTSTGKTLIAELCAINSLEDTGWACVLTPYIALGRQVAASIRLHTKGEGVRVRSLVGGVELNTSVEPGRRRELIVATPERLDAMIRSRPELLKDLKCVVVDESHLIENGSRGVRLEGLISRLRVRQTDGAAFRLILVSAVFPQNQSLETWLGEDTERFTYSWRPTARRLAIWKLGGDLQYFIGDDVSPQN